MNKLTLYYDGQCSLCAREIALLRRISAENIIFSDIHKIGDFSELPTKEDLLKRLHLYSETGEWFLGLNATVKIWSQTRFGILFKILQLPGVRQVAEHLYNRWADRRYCRRYKMCSTVIQ